MRITTIRASASRSFRIDGEQQQRALEMEADIESSDCDDDASNILKERVDTELNRWIDEIQSLDAVLDTTPIQSFRVVSGGIVSQARHTIRSLATLFSASPKNCDMLLVEAETDQDAIESAKAYLSGRIPNAVSKHWHNGKVLFHYIMGNEIPF